MIARDEPECPRCGAAEYSHELHDARGIYIGRVCSQCEPRVRAGYRPDVFTDPDYWTDEPIEPE